MKHKYRNLFPYIGEKTARERLSELFDRKSVTGFLLGATVGGLITTIVSALAPGGLLLLGVATLVRFGLWSFFIGLTLAVAVYWEKIGDVAQDAKETAEETVEDATNNES